MSANTLLRSAPVLTELTRTRHLQVGGITPFTATDYPGKLAAVVYVQGCPWRCGYCHNPHLQQRGGDHAQSWANTMALLRRRVSLIDAVVFSGGEATIDSALPQAIADVRELGFGVGLHTAGVYPARLDQLLPAIDWVGLDIKAPFEIYQRITAIADSGRQALASAHAILASKVAHEFRTTIHPTLLDETEIFSLAQTLSGMGVQNYALQVFRAQGCSDSRLNAVSTIGYPSADLVTRVAALFQQFTLRAA